MRTRAPALMALTALLLLPGAALAQQYEGETDTLDVSTLEPAPGEAVTISGSGFAPGSEVTITIESTPQTLTTVSADADGAFTATVQIPTDLSPGSHTLKATGVTPDGATLVLSTEVTVAGTGAELAETGEGVPRTVFIVAAALAGVLLLGTVGLLVRARH
jgi:hypothetical protein